jgi:hypothetical protein
MIHTMPSYHEFVRNRQLVTKQAQPLAACIDTAGLTSHRQLPVQNFHFNVTTCASIFELQLTVLLVAVRARAAAACGTNVTAYTRYSQTH